MKQNKTIVGLVIATLVLSGAAIAVSAQVGPMDIVPESITDSHISANAVGSSELKNGEDPAYTVSISTGGLDAGAGIITTTGAVNGATMTATTSVTSPSYTGTGAVTVSSGGSAALTLDSDSGTLTLGAGTTAISAPAALTVSSTGADLTLTPGANLVVSSGNFQVTTAGAVSCVGLNAGAGDIDTSGDLTPGSITMTTGTVALPANQIDATELASDAIPFINKTFTDQASASITSAAYSWVNDTASTITTTRASVLFITYSARVADADGDLTTGEVHFKVLLNATDVTPIDIKLADHSHIDIQSTFTVFKWVPAGTHHIGVQAKTTVADEDAEAADQILTVIAIPA